MKYKAVIFDFNGTLFYDDPFHKEAWIKIYTELTGNVFDESLNSIIIGKKNDDILTYMKPDLSEEEKLFYSRKKEALYREICLNYPDKLHLRDGAEELFDYLKEHHISCTIASASIKENIDFFIKTFHLNNWFDTDKIVYDDGTFLNKEEMLYHTCKILNVNPEECIIFEDSVSGITHAKDAKIGYIFGVGSKDKHEYLKTLGADNCIESFHEINIEKLVE